MFPSWRGEDRCVGGGLVGRRRRSFARVGLFPVPGSPLVIFRPSSGSVSSLGGGQAPCGRIVDSRRLVRVLRFFMDDFNAQFKVNPFDRIFARICGVCLASDVSSCC